MAMASIYSALIKSNKSSIKRKVFSNTMLLGGKVAELKEGPFSSTKYSRFFNQMQCYNQIDLRFWWSKRWVINYKAADSTTCMLMTTLCCRTIIVRLMWFLRNVLQRWLNTRIKFGLFNLATWKETNWQVRVRTIRYAFGNWNGSQIKAYS